MTAPVTPDERVTLRALADAATEGPWAMHSVGSAGEEEPSSIVIHTGKFDYADVTDLDGTSAVAWMPAWEHREHCNAEFITAARTAVPRLLDALDTAEAEASRATEAAILYGRIVEQQCIDIAKITRSEHLVSDDGDADWAAIWDRGHGLADRIDRQRDRLRAREEQVRRLRSEVTRLHALVADMRAATSPAWDEDTMRAKVADILRMFLYAGSGDPDHEIDTTAADILAVVRRHLPVRETVERALRDAGLVEAVAVHEGYGAEEVVHAHLRSVVNAVLRARADRIEKGDTR